MPRYGGSGGGGIPSAPATSQARLTLAASSNTDLIVPLDSDGYLASVNLRIAGNAIGNSTTSQCYAELWLLRGGQQMLLDKGAVIAGSSPQAMNVGGSGGLAVERGSQLLIRGINWTSTAIILECDAWIHEGSSSPGTWNALAMNIKGTWIYQARRVLTAAVAGGPLDIQITLASGQSGRLVSLKMVGPASAGNIPEIHILDEDGGSHMQLATCAAGASRILNLPSIGTAASASSNTVNSTGLLLAPGQQIGIINPTALNTEELTVAISLELSIPTVPTWTTTGSGAGATLAASSISEANTLQWVFAL